jgi:hypothetical protein
MVSLLVMVCVSVVTGREAKSDDRAQAEALWNRAIAAKGGRERLSSIQSFAIKERALFDKPTRPDMAVGQVEQIVVELPDLWWSFSDYRPGKMGYMVRVVNTTTGRHWATANGTPGKTAPDRSTSERLRRFEYVYFLETRWVRPTPLRASRVQFGRRPVDRVETEIDGQPVVFELDVETHLPVRIETSVTSDVPRARAGAVTAARRYVFELTAYHEVSGIHVPGRVSLGGDPADVEVEINPAYDPTIFAAPPPPETRIDSWRQRADQH